MNRRTFLKSVGIACGAAVVCPGELLKGEPAVGIDPNKPKRSGVTNEQLREFIQVALKDLPPVTFENAFTNQTYRLCRNSKNE